MIACALKSKGGIYFLRILLFGILLIEGGSLCLAQEIAFVSDRDGNLEIYLMDMDGSNQRRLTNDPGADICPVFSPDGRTIAFLSNRSGSFRIYTMRWDGSEVQEIPNSACEPGGWSSAGRGLAWSPDGQKLLFKPTYDALATIKLDGSNKTVLLSGGVDGHDCIQGVEWGPTMDDVYFNAQVCPWIYDQHIFHYSISGGICTQITLDIEPSHSHSPRVARYGSRIVFSRQQGWEGPENIFTMGLDGSSESQLTFDEGTTLNYTPDWVGDSNEIVFSSNRSGGVRQIWLMDATGANIRMLAGAGNNFTPSWTAGPRCSPIYVDAVNGDDNNDGLTPDTAFATIQKGIDTAEDGDSVIVYPGTYTEAIYFDSKAITVTSAAEAAVIEAPGDYAVSFYVVQGPNSLLKNFVIRGSDLGIFIVGGSPTISNVTVVDNEFGVAAHAAAEPNICNSIFWNNTDGDLFQCQARYSCVEEESAGEGNIHSNPLFADPNNADFHLKSQAGRWDPNTQSWVLDSITSPCIDAGDPNSPVGDEPPPNGGRINMGAYGGTEKASKSYAGGPAINGSNIADINNDGKVDFKDLEIITTNWLWKAP